MALHFLICYYYLIAQVLIFMIFSVPWPRPIRSAILRFLFDTSAMKYYMKVQKYLLLVVIVIFCDAVRSQYYEQQQLDLMHKHDEMTDSNLLIQAEALKYKTEIKMYRAQRNIYMTGLCMIVSYAIMMYMNLLRNWEDVDIQLEGKDATQHGPGRGKSGVELGAVIDPKPVEARLNEKEPVKMRIQEDDAAASRRNFVTPTPQ